MKKLIVFNSVSADGYFTDAKGDMRWAHRNADPEWTAFVARNAQNECVMIFGRVTYEMMAHWWPTPQAMQTMPKVAKRMNGSAKVVFSRTLAEAPWQNSKLVKADPVATIRKMKRGSGPDLVIFGSGTIVSQLTQHSLIDEYQMVVNPIVLGSGRTMFEGVKKPLNLKLTKSRRFKNGNVLMHYEPLR